MAQGIYGPAFLIGGTRIVNLAVGLLTIPLLIHYLGGVGFAAWAILLAVAGVLSTLELGMPSAVVKFLAAPIQDGERGEGVRILSNVFAFHLLTFGIGLPLVLWQAEAVVRWLRLPDGLWLSARGMVLLVFAAVAARTLLQNGTYILYAARRFNLVAAFSFFQPFVSNCAAILAAWQSGRLDVTLAAFWTAQVAVVGAGFWLARGVFAIRFRPSLVGLAKLREIVSHGIKTQINGWAQVVNFQFDKFIIAGFVGLWAVAPYEVANRGVVALRSVPASGIETFLPTAAISQAQGKDAWERYLAVTRMAAYGVLVFLIAPLAIAPMFLYAWTGEMGYVGRWVFPALAFGAIANLLAFPAATMAQAAGRAGLEARAAAISILLNIPLSLMLITKWGMTGAAIGTGIAMVISAVVLMRSVHGLFGRRLSETLGLLAQLWPLLLVCLAWGVLAHVYFDSWFASLDPQGRFSRHNRLWPAILSGLVYVACLGTMLFVQIYRGALRVEERELLVRLIPFRWFNAFCQRHSQ